MLRKHDARLHHVQVVNPVRVAGAQPPGEAIGLLLVVTLEADPVPRPQDRFEEVDDGGGRHDLAVGMGATCLEAGVPGLPLNAPLGHPCALTPLSDPF